VANITAEPSNNGTHRISEGEGSDWAAEITMLDEEATEGVFAGLGVA
jgi:hypothetical protein